MIKAGIKRLLRWDAKTPREKSAALYRVRNLFATAICLLPLPVRWLPRIFGSDKHRPDAHLYGWTYQELFRPLKYRRIKLLEIGIGGTADDVGGRSLLVWQAFFPFATIVGVDYQPREAVATRSGRIRSTLAACTGTGRTSTMPISAEPAWDTSSSSPST